MRGILPCLLYFFSFSSCSESINSKVNNIQRENSNADSAIIVKGELCGKFLIIEVENNIYFIFENFDFELARKQRELIYNSNDSGFYLKHYLIGDPDICSDVVIVNTDDSYESLQFTFGSLKISFIEEINYRNYFSIELVNLRYDNKFRSKIIVPRVPLNFGG